MYKPGDLPYSVALLSVGLNRNTSTSSSDKNDWYCFARGVFQIKFFLLIFLLLFFQFKKSFSKEELLNIVITPTRFVEKVKKTNSFVNVITAEQIKKSTANNLIELLI